MKRLIKSEAIASKLLGEKYLLVLYIHAYYIHPYNDVRLNGFLSIATSIYFIRKTDIYCLQKKHF